VKRGLTAGRGAALRAALASAATTAECVPALAGLIDIARELHEEGGTRADDARAILDEVLSYLRAAHAGLPAGPRDGPPGHGDQDSHPGQGIAGTAALLYLTAEASLLRGSDASPVSDLDNAIECLRRLRPMLPDDSEERSEIEARLASAALTRAGGAGGRLADVDEAGAILAGLLDRTPPGSPARRQVLRAAAVQRGLRFMCFGGTEEDRVAGIGCARECLAIPGVPDGPDQAADVSHFMIAWLTLARQLTGTQRSMVFRRAEIEASRHDGALAATLLGELGHIEISRADADAALGHLRQVTTTPADAQLRGIAPILWTLALITRVRDGDPGSIALIADDLRHVTAELEVAASQAPQDADEFLGLRAMLLGLLAQAAGDTSQSPQARAATKALSDAATRMPRGHPARQAELALLRTGLTRQVAEAGQADDVAAGLDQVMTALDDMSPGDPDFASLIASVSARMLGLGAERRSALHDERFAPQLERAIAGLDANDPMRSFAEAMYWVHSGAQAAVGQRPELVDQAIAELRQRAEAAPEGFIRTFMLTIVAYALTDRGAMGGELRHLVEARKYLELAFASIGPGSPFADGGAAHPGLLYLRAHLELMWCYYDNDMSRIRRAIGDLERAVAQSGADSPLHPMVAHELDAARALSEMLAGTSSGGMVIPDAARAAFGNLLSEAERLGQDHPEYPSVVAQAVSGLALQGLADRDPKLIDRAIAMLGEACTAPSLATRERPRLLHLHGFALLTRYVSQRKPRDLAYAIDRLEEARRAVEQEVGSPFTGDVLQTLASAYRRRGDAARGDVDRAVTLGLAALRERVGDAVLQDSDDHALHVARRGTGDAIEMVRWFLGRDRDAAAISALELGRGMVLHAATSGIGVEDALRQAGHADLAVQWAAGRSPGGAGAAESGLRYQVMLAIEQSPAEARLLSPPSVGDIAAALAESAADALVYLLPTDERGYGLAVLVDPAKDVRVVHLPRLFADDRGPVAAFVRARLAADQADWRAVSVQSQPGAGPREKRDAQASADAMSKAWEDALGRVCGWAWGAAIRRVLAAIPEPGNGRDRRVVLIPSGELGLVPWHAARQPGTGTYACERAVFSYASSARQFIDATQRRPRPWDQAPVLISDPTGSAWLTATGIRHLHAQHYPAARVYGDARCPSGRPGDQLPDTVPGSAAATSDDVRAALPGERTSGASLLHFGCHGRAETPVLDSQLDLGAGGALLVKDILSQAREWRNGRHDETASCGLVILASCLSDVANADYDEALTLATAFMSAGAGGVVAARWRVADSATALLMSAFHRYLNAGIDPAPALRRAQLWMIDPDRAVPPGLPAVLRDEAELSGEPGFLDLTTPAAWAGFAYQGR
jgi:CHAT domain-containing protein